MEGEERSEPSQAALGVAPTIGAGEPGWQVAKQSIHRALFPEVGAERVRMGRFELLRRLGRGGMGEVYVAYDEQLDRQVALKVLLHEHAASEQACERLLREAQVLARLSHPNVVQIHEAGIHEGQVYLVMELVDGVTLREWLDARSEGAVRPWKEVLPVMIAAGQGLVAAHAAGLTHRDFKPDNVLVGKDGRVRVLDFGLARPGAAVDELSLGAMPTGDPAELDPMATVVDGPIAAGSKASASADSGSRRGASSGSGSRRSIVQLTEPGRIVGTLTYMAPEQLAAAPLDARCDQYAFCVTLYEALYGERPFTGRTFAAYMIALSQGKIVEPATKALVPRWLQLLVRKGLSARPDDRFADMETLLHELSRPRGRAWKAGLAAGSLVLAGAASTWALAPAETPPCALDETALAGTWDAARREAIATSFASAGSSSEALTAVNDALSRWSTTWLASLRSACEATHVSGTQSEAMLDLRSGCLEQQRREVTALVELLADPDVDPDHARALLEQLPDAGACGDPRLGETPYPLPGDPARREAILAAYQQLGRVRALGQLGRLTEADALVGELDATIATLDYRPLSVEGLSLAADRSLWRQRLEEAVPQLRAAIRQAEIAGLDEQSATLRVRLASHVVGQSGRPELQAVVLEEAETAVARIGRSDDRRALELRFIHAMWLEDHGDQARALAEYRSAIDAARDRGELGLAGNGLRSEALLLVQLDRFAAARAAYGEARAMYEQSWGPSTLVDANTELDLGWLELERGDLQAATTRFAAARRLLESRVAPGARDFAMLELAEAKLATMRGDLGRAREGFSRVLETTSDDLRRGEAWEALGVIGFYEGDASGSLDAYRRARSLRLATLGPEHPSLGILESNIGESLALGGDHQGALRAYGEALALLERVLPPDHGHLALPYKGRAQSRLALGDVAGARLDLERALLLHETNPGEPVERADVERTLAQVLLRLGERERALALAAAARQRLADLGHDEGAATISAWIDEHQ